ncbi:MAG: metal-dependent hydrolase [Abitibacteriaceae bacterium]|nr:metal-dependent hydrolase [Abditibacteriaceae bacterium]MBV9868134.1 metal-dependent hydrolase [Abditibacteriaceae bacterium]
MMWRTHLLYGINALWVLTLIPADLLACDFGSLAACAALGALLPDLDAAESKVKHLQIISIKPFFPVAEVVHRSDRHRGLLHSLLGLGLVMISLVTLSDWTGWAPIAALLLGYASHLAADASTKSGIPLLYPREQRFYLLPKRCRITTGSLAEDMLLPFLAAFALLLLLNQLNAMQP